ncbi:MAG: type II toxin-antitoxin system RelE/ParE family toxin [Armatimonadetes bacterium]|nr:type II toxin-antitoxin system RelE/ParE family toxin [Armatimonadota bacterium]
MNFAFDDRKLQTLYITGKGKIARQLAREIIDKFFISLEIVASVTSTDQLRQFRGLNYEALKGNRKGQHSLRLNDQYRLIVEESVDGNGQILLIIEIDDYH